MSDLALIAEEKHFSDWMGRVNALCVDRLSAPADCLPDANWAEFCADGLSPEEAFDAYHEDQFGESWQAMNGQFGVGT